MAFQPTEKQCTLRGVPAGSVGKKMRSCADRRMGSLYCRFGQRLVRHVQWRRPQQSKPRQRKLLAISSLHQSTCLWAQLMFLPLRSEVWMQEHFRHNTRQCMKLPCARTECPQHAFLLQPHSLYLKVATNPAILMRLSLKVAGTLSHTLQGHCLQQTLLQHIQYVLSCSPHSLSLPDCYTSDCYPTLHTRSNLSCYLRHADPPSCHPSSLGSLGRLLHHPTYRHSNLSSPFVINTMSHQRNQSCQFGSPINLTQGHHCSKQGSGSKSMAPPTWHSSLRTCTRI